MFPTDTISVDFNTTVTADSLNQLIVAGTSTKTILAVSYSSNLSKDVSVYCGSNSGGNAPVIYSSKGSPNNNAQILLVYKCSQPIYADKMGRTWLNMTYLPYDTALYNTSVYEYKLSSPFQLTRGTQDFIMLLGLSAFIILLALKVFYLFFYKAVRK